MKDMLKKFNTTETWIDVETLANLKGISKRAIRLSFNSKNSNYETKIENGKGGHLYKIRLSSIEEELQIKYMRFPAHLCIGSTPRCACRHKSGFSQSGGRCTPCPAPSDAGTS